MNYTAILLKIIIALYSFIVSNPSIPQDVKDESIKLISTTFQSGVIEQTACSPVVSNVSTGVSNSVSTGSVNNQVENVPVNATITPMEKINWNPEYELTNVENVYGQIEKAYNTIKQAHVLNLNVSYTLVIRDVDVDTSTYSFRAVTNQIIYINGQSIPVGTDVGGGGFSGKVIKQLYPSDYDTLTLQ